MAVGGRGGELSGPGRAADVRMPRSWGGPELARGIAIAEVISRRSLRCSKRRVPLMTRRSLRFLNRRSQDGLCQPAVLKSACPGRPVPACAFLARVLRTARASLDRVLSKTAAASLRSYSRGS